MSRPVDMFIRHTRLLGRAAKNNISTKRERRGTLSHKLPPIFHLLRQRALRKGVSEVVESGKLNLSMFNWLLGDAQMEISNQQLNMGGECLEFRTEKARL